MDQRIVLAGMHDIAHGEEQLPAQGSARMEHSKWFESLQPETPVAAEKTEARPEA